MDFSYYVLAGILRHKQEHFNLSMFNVTWRRNSPNDRTACQQI